MYKVFYKVYEDNSKPIRVDFEDEYETMNRATSDILCYIAKILYEIKDETHIDLCVDNLRFYLEVDKKRYEFFIGRII